MRHSSRIGPLFAAGAAVVSAVVVAAAVMPDPVFAQDPSARAERIQALLQRYHQVGLFSGSVLVAEEGTVIYSGAFGLADAASGAPNRPDTRFPVDSIARTFAAALVLLLEEGGQIDQSADLDESDEAAGQTPRTLVERVTGSPYEDVLEERLLRPLELRQTGYGRAGEGIPPASGHQSRLTGYTPLPLPDTAAVQGPQPAERVSDAGPPFLSTVGDLLLWDQALHGGFVFADPRTAERMFPVGESAGDSVQSTGELDESGSDPVRRTSAIRGYGWKVHEVALDEHEKPVWVIESAGAQPGFSSQLRRYPAAGHTVVVLDNSSNDTGPIVLGVSRILFGLPPEMPKPSIAERILPIVEAAGVEAALGRYRERLSNAPDAYTYGPGELARLGLHFLSVGEPGAALEALEANVELHPESSIAYDGLGEASLAVGDTARAVEAYGSSLELDPERDAARQHLTALGVTIEPALRPRVDFPEEVLEGFVGSYQLRPGEYVVVRREGTNLFARPGDQAEVELVATSQGRFVVRGLPLRFDFHLGPDGKATAVTVVEEERSVTARRIP